MAVLEKEVSIACGSRRYIGDQLLHLADCIDVHFGFEHIEDHYLNGHSLERLTHSEA